MGRFFVVNGRRFMFKKGQKPTKQPEPASTKQTRSDVTSSDKEANKIYDQIINNGIVSK